MICAGGTCTIRHHLVEFNEMVGKPKKTKPGSMNCFRDDRE